jgi:DNA modification methylase
MPQQKTMTGGRKTGIRPILKPNLLRVNRPTGDDRQHNAAKPTDLIREILEVATDPGAIVLDLFAGSGSTLIACDQIDRRCFLVDVEPAWCDVVRTRYAEHSGDMSLVP